MDKKNSFFPLFISIAIVSSIIFFIYKYIIQSSSTNDTQKENYVVKEVNNLKDEDSLKEGEKEGILVEEYRNQNNIDAQKDFSKYTLDSMSLGEKSGSRKYRLLSINKIFDNEIYSFIFNLEAEEDQADEPYITATYIKSAGVIRVVLDRVYEDKSGIGYQDGVSINKDGIIKLYHNISPNSTEELYDIGIASQAPFFLTSKSIGENMYAITLDIKFPGEKESNNIDLGSNEFSQNSQEILGAVSKDGAKVSGYSYSASDGILKFVLKVSGSDLKPIPSVKVGKGNGGELDMIFESLVSDSVAKGSQIILLPGNVKLYTQHNVGKSTYTFTNISKEFKLYAITNPNEVVLEIKL